MINWDQLNASLRRALRAVPACGVLIMIAAVILAVFDRSAQTALTGIALGLIVLVLGLSAPGAGPLAAPHSAAQPRPEAKEPEAPAPAPEKPAAAQYCPHCGALRVEPGQKFCIACGKRLKR